MSWSVLIPVIILTIIIYSLTFTSYSLTIKHLKADILAGSQDTEILENLEKQKHKKNKINVFDIISKTFSILLILFFAFVFVISIIYKTHNETFSISGKTSLVIVTNSMEKYWNQAYAEALKEVKPDASNQQFNVGDIVFFEKVSDDEELIMYDVYGYQNVSGQIITHRLVDIKEDEDGIRYIFRGDNTMSTDSSVSRNKILYHYTEQKVEKIGLVLLFLRSTFGLYVIIGIIGISIISNFFMHKYENILDERSEFLKEQEEEKKLALEEQESDEYYNQLQEEVNKLVPGFNDDNKETNTVEETEYVYYDEDGNEIDPSTLTEQDVIYEENEETGEEEIIYVDENGNEVSPDEIQTETTDLENTSEEKLADSSENLPIDKEEFAVEQTEDEEIEYVDEDGNPISKEEYEKLINQEEIEYVDEEGNIISKEEYEKIMSEYSNDN